MRRIGGGYQSLKKFLMGHLPPMTDKNYRNISNLFNQKIKEVAETLLQEACKDIRGSLDSEFIDTGVTDDGTLQTRGFTSMNGAVAAISIDTGRVLDIDIVSQGCYCQVVSWDVSIDTGRVLGIDIVSRYCQGCIN